MNCLECGKPVKQTAGKRAKMYCNPSCRSKYFVKQKKADNPNPRKPGRPKKETIPLPDDYVRIEKVKILTADGKELPLSFKPQNQPITNEFGKVLVEAKKSPKRPNTPSSSEMYQKEEAKPYPENWSSMGKLERLKWLTANQ